MESSGSNTNTTSDGGAWSAEEAIAGNNEALQALRELITYPLLYRRESQKLGLKWPRGLLLYGPPGTGKTSLVRAVVRECGAHLRVISPHSVHRAHAGESERILRESFAEALTKAKESGKPSVIFIDEIDALCPRRDSRKEHEIRVTSQLIMLMDANNKSSSSSSTHVVVIASTNRVDTIDPALRRSGRFHEEIEVTTPNEEERFQILKLYAKKIPLDPNVDLKSVAASCNGYVGADLEALCREAALSAVRKSSDTNVGESVSITMDDWKHARSIVGPSITRGVTVEVPKVSWDDIGGLHELKKKLQQAVEWPLKHAAAFSRLGVSPVRGILLHGPPGCSKTTLAKAAGHAAQASFFSLSGAELFSMYVGEGEALLRNTFRRARLAAPSIIFFDEADVVAAKRGGSSSGSTVVGERLLSTLLTEMDGLEQTKGILVLAATNRPYAIDAALMRPGRFDLVLYVPPPDIDARDEILRVHTRNMSVDPNIDLRKLAEETDLFTGAELEGLCKEAGIVALREDIAATVVCDRHFQKVKRSLKPALTKEEVNTYASFMKNPNMMRPPFEQQQSKEIQSKHGSKNRRNLLGVYVPITSCSKNFSWLCSIAERKKTLFDNRVCKGRNFLWLSRSWAKFKNMVEWWWSAVAAAIPVVITGQALRMKNSRAEEQRLTSARGREKSSDEIFVCERVCTSKRMLKKVGSFSKDPIQDTCVTVCGVSQLDACADACARTVCVNQHQVPNWNDTCLKRCQSECLRLSNNSSAV